MHEIYAPTAAMSKVNAGSAYFNMRITQITNFSVFYHCRVDGWIRYVNDRVHANILMRFQLNENALIWKRIRFDVALVPYTDMQGESTYTVQNHCDAGVRCLGTGKPWGKQKKNYREHQDINRNESDEKKDEILESLDWWKMSRRRFGWQRGKSWQEPVRWI